MNLKRCIVADLAILYMARVCLPTAPLDSWTQLNLGTNNITLGAVCYANGLFVAVGGNQAYVQNGQYVGNAVILTSPDGNNWTQQDFTNVDIISAVTYGNGQFVAGGENYANPPNIKENVILTSPDGVHWNQTNLATGYWLWGIAYGNGVFVADGGSCILTSKDGVNWLQQDYSAFGITYDNNYFIAAGNGETFTSIDGTNWSVNSVGDNLLYDVCFGNGLYVAVGYSYYGTPYGVILTSPDAINWTPRTSNSQNLLFNFLWGATYGAGQLVAVGDSGIILTSPDGVNWIQRNSGTRIGLWSVAYGDGTFVAVGNVPLLVSGPIPLGKPIIITQPQSQIVPVGSNAVLNIVAYSQQPLTYQWQFNGNPIAVATNASLSLTNVQLSNVGNYSVIVSNSYGSVTSATASLKLLADPANGNQPLLISPLDGPPQLPGVDSLIVIAHGWEFGGPSRSEERRVGKECRSRWSPY